MNSYSKGRFKAGFSALPGRLRNLLCFTFFLLFYFFYLYSYFVGLTDFFFIYPANRNESKRFFCFYFWKTRELWVTYGAKKSNWLWVWSLSSSFLFACFCFCRNEMETLTCAPPLFRAPAKVNSMPSGKNQESKREGLIRSPCPALLIGLSVILNCMIFLIAYFCWFDSFFRFFLYLPPMRLLLLVFWIGINNRRHGASRFIRIFISLCIWLTLSPSPSHSQRPLWLLLLRAVDVAVVVLLLLLLLLLCVSRFTHICTRSHYTHTHGGLWLF